MAEFTLPANSKVGTGKTYPAPAGAKRVRAFKIYRWNPEDGRQSAARHLRGRSRHLRADGPRRADQDQERDRHDADLPPLLPRRHLRLVRDEHRRHQHARLPQGDRRGEGRRADLSAAAHAGGQGPGARPDPHLRAVPLDRAVAAERQRAAARPRAARSRSASARSSTGSGNASCASAARRAARAIGGTASAISARPSCCRPIAGSPTAATSAPASGSTRSRIRSGSIAATPS